MSWAFTSLPRTDMYGRCKDTKLEPKHIVFDDKTALLRLWRIVRTDCYNMKKVNNNTILAVIAAALCAVCFMSIYTPVRFDSQQEVRGRAVKERLVKIRHAEEMYRRQHGVYAGDFATLISGGYLSDSLQYIPYSDKRRFDLAATTAIGKSGRQTPLMECGAKYNEYLGGLDENSIANLIEQANNEGRYPGLKIGDLLTPNDNMGNWE